MKIGRNGVFHLIWIIFSLQETDTATIRVKVGKKKFSCKFEIVHRDSLILMDESSVDCTPNKPARQKAFNLRLKGSHGYDFSASILINPDVLTDVFVGRNPNLTLR